MKSYYCLFLSLVIVAISIPLMESEAASKKSIYALEYVTTSEDSSDQIHDQVKTLAQGMSDPVVVKERALAILEQVKEGSDISEYDFLWTPYSLLKIAYSGSGSGLAESDELVLALSTIDYLDANGVGDWHYTDEGQFKMEVYRAAANSAAWSLRESDPRQALQIIDSGLEHARDDDMYMLDTKVRILLNMNSAEQAFAIVRDVLEQTPEFGDFQDFRDNDEYLTWAKNN